VPDEAGTSIEGESELTDEVPELGETEVADVSSESESPVLDDAEVEVVN
jgi:hypothetical protein